MPLESDVWMPMREVMERLTVSRKTVLTMVARGHIRRRETSSHHRYFRADVERAAAEYGIREEKAHA